jgi:hypothetical protein
MWRARSMRGPRTGPCDANASDVKSTGQGASRSLEAITAMVRWYTSARFQSLSTA